MEEKLKDVARVFKALCDENRLMIIEKLKTGEECACNLLEEIPVGQSTLSHHMKILVDSGLVEARKDKKWTYYALNAEGFANAAAILDGIAEGIPELTETVSCSCN
jgi:ArsR family transcriptional regulator